MMPLSKSSISQSENMQKAQPEIAKLEQKYKDKNDQNAMMMKSQETMAIYKKYKIKPITTRSQHYGARSDLETATCPCDLWQ